MLKKARYGDGLAFNLSDHKGSQGTRFFGVFKKLKKGRLPDAYEFIDLGMALVNTRFYAELKAFL